MIAAAAARVGAFLETARHSVWGVHLGALVGYAGWVYSHSLNVALLAIMIGERLGLDRQAGQALGLGALLHDIGMVLVPPEVLNRPGRLRAEEWLLVRQHPRVGCDMLRPLAMEDSVLTIIAQHHERYDGSGYPAGIRGSEISLLAGIVAIADAFDAVTSERSYRLRLEPRQAFALIKKEQHLFLPEAVAGLERVLPPAWHSASGGQEE
ncbi:HD-GYP domain-containing protein [Thermosinus carboxydivorans]|uniref:HD-GYP domain-containing protein n=1 Tax=Thermosinus carboxydivorans TaxID=261685 RepID=UPI0002D3CCBF|nr:HD domain-containing phosphohydrolase [Thermosinus carboxydivorans]